MALSSVIPGIRHPLLAALLGASLLAACSSAPPPAADLPHREAVLETALGQIGRPYRYGGGDGDGFDCSGLVQYVFDQAGVPMPRTASLQYERGNAIDSQYAAPGDLVFFRIDGRLHVAIYVGDGRFIHAPASGQDVTLAAINSPYWQQHLVSVVRVLR